MPWQESELLVLNLSLFLWFFDWTLELFWKCGIFGVFFILFYQFVLSTAEELLFLELKFSWIYNIQRNIKKNILLLFCYKYETRYYSRNETCTLNFIFTFIWTNQGHYTIKFGFHENKYFHNLTCNSYFRYDGGDNIIQYYDCLPSMKPCPTTTLRNSMHSTNIGEEINVESLPEQSSRIYTLSYTSTVSK